MMRSFLVIVVILFTNAVVKSQNATTKGMLAEIEGEWKVDAQGFVTYTRIIDVPNVPKAKLFSRAKNYFVYHYNTERSIIQSRAEDKDLGSFVYKGLYNDIHSGFAIHTILVDCWHTIRVDVKDGKARIILSLNEYEVETQFDVDPPKFKTTLISREFPFNPQAYSKNIMGKAFYHSHKSAMNTLNSLEQAIKNGNISAELDHDDW